MQGLTQLPLSQDEFEDLQRGAEILEQDSRGLKVLRLADGDMLKLFRVKRLFSSAQLFPYSRRFCRNAIRLRALGIPTLAPKALFLLPARGVTAVRYLPLSGRTLRQLAQDGALDEALLRQLGAFVARLHDLGVYFRSLHLGNIVRMPAGELGLIDVADLSIRPWRLLCNERLRNFRHLTRLRQDWQLVGAHGRELFLTAYLEACACQFRCSSLKHKAHALMVECH